MIQEIKCNRLLLPYLAQVIEDEGIEVEVAADIEETKIAIIKVDDYYNGLQLTNPPKSIDFLVVVDCECDAYVLYLLELKNVNSPKHLDIKAIQEKFTTTIEDFIKIRFANIFLKDRYKYKKILLYLVSDAYHLCGKYRDFEAYKAIQEKMNKKDSLKIETSLGRKLYRIKGKILRIEFDFPPNPGITRIID